MTWADQDNRDERELIRVAITGKGEEWGRLQEKIYSIVDVIAQRIQDHTSANPAKVEGSAEALKDLSTLAANWARAKIE